MLAKGVIIDPFLTVLVPHSHPRGDPFPEVLVPHSHLTGGIGRVDPA